MTQRTGLLRASVRTEPISESGGARKLAIALEGSYAKFLRGQSDKPLHEFFGRQADLLLESAERIIERKATR